MRRILALLAVALVPFAVPRGARAQAEPTYLQPGDQIHLVVFRQPEFTGDFTVSAEGTIQHPLLTDVSVVDASRSVIRERLRAALARYDRDPAFVFDFLYRVAVWGEVRQPNLLRVPPQTTVAEAIAAAGGATETAALNKVRLLREGRESVVDVQGGEGAGMRIRSGDQIRIPRRTSVLRDVVAPFASLVGAVAAVAAVLRIK